MNIVENTSQCYINGWMRNVRLTNNQDICQDCVNEIKVLKEKTSSKLHLIKAVRDKFGLGLRDAKEIAEGVTLIVNLEESKAQEKDYITNKTITNSSVHQFVYDLINRENIPFFIGGSTRWGWTRVNSDLDVFLLIEESHEDCLSSYPHTVNCLMNNFARKYSLNERHDGNYPSSIFHYESRILGVDIDFLIFHNKEEFEQLKNEHEELEKYISSWQKETKQKLMYFLTVASLSGKDKYRLLIKEMHKEYN